MYIARCCDLLRRNVCHVYSFYDLIKKEMQAMEDLFFIVMGVLFIIVIEINTNVHMARLQKRDNTVNQYYFVVLNQN